ncbi:hypothetical protein TKK_0006442 [Trichogramma kaykai]|uniref:Choline transporter-like protein n=1 Tax=Trichogramma kaykai TaxID=54128 RepID=A0ABD2XDZ1_9HYME
MNSREDSVEELPDYGLKFGYDPFWRGPLRVHRGLTDKPCLLILIVAIIIYAVLSYYGWQWRFWMTDAYRVEKISEGMKEFVPMNKWAAATKAIFDQRWVITGGLVLTGALSIFCLMLMRVSAWAVIYSSIFVLFSVVCAGIAYLAYYFGIDPSVLKLVYLILAIGLFIFLLFVFKIKAKFIPVCCELVRESSRVMMFFPSMFLLSVFIWGLTGCLIGWSALIFSIWFKYRQCAASFGKEEKEVYVYLFALCPCGVGMVVALFAFFRMVAAGSYSTWYWTMDKRRVPHLTPIRFILIVFLHHLGTATLGGPIVVLCKVFRFLTGIFRLLEGRDVPNPLSYLLRCITMFLNFIFVFVALFDPYSDETYIFTAIHGDNFCTSSKQSFHLGRRNRSKIRVLRHMITVLVLIFTLAVCTIVGLLMWLVLAQVMKLSIIQSPFGLVFVVVLIFLLAHILFMQLDVASNTLFLCACEDYERNAASLRPYHMTDKLRELIISRNLPE